VVKQYSQMKLQMKREALAKLNRRANETSAAGSDTEGHGPGEGAKSVLDQQRGQTVSPDW
jgi:hypothetical protein